MPPKKVVAGAASAPASSQQRSIQSFFKTGLEASGSKVDSSSNPSKPPLNIPANGSSPSVKRARTGSKPKSSSSVSGKADEKVELKDPASPEMNGMDKGPSPKKLPSEVQTPSPTEAPCPAQSVTKCFGRRGKNSVKARGTAPSPPLESGKSGNGRVTPNPGESVIGMRLRVWWPLDKVWYPGRIRAYNKDKGTHVIAYDDGEDETVTLSKEKLDWLDENEAVEGLQKLASGRSKRRGWSRDEDLSSNGKRKKVTSEQITEEIPKDQTDEGDGTPGKSARRNKRARLTAVEESPVKLTITGDVCDEVEMALPNEEEVKVRRRLRKKVTVKEEPKAEEVEMLDVEDLEVATTLAEQKLENVDSLDQRLGTSARRLLLGKVSGPLPSFSEDDEDSPKNETLADLASKKPTIKTEKSLAGMRSVKDLFTERLSGGRTKKTSMERKSASSSPLTDAQGTARLEQPKLAPLDRQELVDALTGGLQGGSDEAAEVRKSLQETEAERLSRGELHATLVGEAARFLGRAEEKFKFLIKDRKDASGRRPSDPDYDPRTVFLPPTFLKDLSGGQRQWWEFKAKHMDKVLLFKMGKFYEMFEMDAHIGAQELDLQYMKGEQPHCGFPEKNYAVNAEKLAQKGYRVLIVEQTETPEQLEQRKRKTGSKDKVVRREVCGIITKGTLVDGEMLIARPDAAYLLSITERESLSCETPEDDPLNPSRNTTGSPEKTCTVGMCVVDTSTSHVMLGQFNDDVARTRLRGLLAELRPVEIIKPRGLLTEATERAIKDHTRQPLVTALAPGKEFWDAERSVNEIMKAYLSLQTKEGPSETAQDKNEETELELREKYLPEALLQVIEADDLGEAALSALGGAVFYLKQALLDQTVLRLGRMDLLPGSDSFDLAKTSSRERRKSCGDTVAIRDAEGHSGQGVEPYMLMDAAALENLEVLENNRDGGVAGTLLGHLDSCVTPYGRRLLRQWLVRPLIRVDTVVKRQEAVCELKTIAAEAAAGFRKELRSQADMERLLARLYAASDESGRNAQKVVLYEDAAKKLLQELLAALRGCQALLQAVNSFATIGSKLTSSRLQQLISPDGGLSEMLELIKHFEDAFDWNASEESGRVIPSAIGGIDPDVDEANATISAVTEKLDDYLNKQRKKFGNFTEIKYQNVGKDPYQIEIPDELHSKVPASYELVSSRKGYQRYWTPEIKEMLQELSAAKERRESSLQGILRSLVKRFCENYQKWLCLIKSVAELDVLISLAEASEYTSPACMPSLIPAEKTDLNVSPEPTISAKGLRHPTLRVSGGGAVVPNDIDLGGGQTSFMLLTGPNMGGKSTLIRQVCLAVILAQVGAYVPAEHFELTPVDKMFVRMGAKDHIMTGQSTFLVEMSETAAMLRGATRNSLVALDELGRGTSTADGQAIAHAVMQHLVAQVGCRGMFSTHYHKLSSSFSTSDTKVGLYHMACTVGTEAGGLEEVTFLYKLAPGPCPKSYGVNVARLAGIPETVLKRAVARSAELESSWAEKDGNQTEVHAEVPADSSVSDCKIRKDVSALIYRLLVEVDKNSSCDDLTSAQGAVQTLLKVNKVDLMWN
ncbi:hypothetical protein R1sor_020683 [Riccia sorocarpa]|uniref:DNA mismatch repair protein n=1 Tax=Riccia sorocarpa TaxID=122646 RepID=A0ABD3GGN0_9MARC